MIKPAFGVYDQLVVRNSPRVGTAALPIRPVYAILGQKAVQGLAWLYESLMGRVAPGAAWTVPGHDHADYGGWPIPRGAAASLDVGGEANLGSNYGYYHSISVANVWEVMGADGEPRPTGEGYIRAYASPGIDSVASWGGTGFEAKVCYMASGSGTLQLRIYNELTQTGTDPLTLTKDGNPHWLHFAHTVVVDTSIPCRERSVNPLQLQLRSDTPGDNAQVVACVVAETVEESQPPYDGGATEAWDDATLRPF